MVTRRARSLRVCAIGSRNMLLLAVLLQIFAFAAARSTSSPEDLVAEMLVPVNGTESTKESLEEGSGFGYPEDHPIQPLNNFIMERMVKGSDADDAAKEDETQNDEGSGAMPSETETSNATIILGEDENLDQVEVLPVATSEESKEDVPISKAAKILDATLDETAENAAEDEEKTGAAAKTSEESPEDTATTEDAVTTLPAVSDESIEPNVASAVITTAEAALPKESSEEAAESPEKADDLDAETHEEKADEDNVVTETALSAEEDAKASKETTEDETEESAKTAGIHDLPIETPETTDTVEEVVTSGPHSVENIETPHTETPEVSAEDEEVTEPTPTVPEIVPVSKESKEESKEESSEEISITTNIPELEPTKVKDTSTSEEDSVESLPELPKADITDESTTIATANEALEEEAVERVVVPLIAASPSTEQNVVSSSESSEISHSSSTEGASTTPTTVATSPVTEDSSTTVDGLFFQKASSLLKVSENIQPENDEEYSKTRTVAMYTLGGLLVVSLIVLIVIIVFRRRHSNKYRPDEERDISTDKALLSNGKYKDDSDEVSVKNNEITPLVIKQNSQINKFEKNPNFSSPKNLNTRANDKNIEKDNVLKSTTQAILEGESDDDKKEDSEDKKKLEEDEVEKVVVRTLLDEDSIPRKPVIISRNGHNYQSLPGGETKT